MALGVMGGVETATELRKAIGVKNIFGLRTRSRGDLLDALRSTVNQLDISASDEAIENLADELSESDGNDD